MRLIFLEKQRRLGDVYSFWFRTPENVSWLAGQSIRLEVPVEFDTDERRFSISSAPFEKDICITTRISDSEFKQALHALKPGDEINGYDITGNFVWQHSPLKRIFCAQGIGITAFFPILKQLAHEKKSRKITLLYAARGNHFVFEEELKKLQAEHPEFEIIFLPEQKLSAEIITAHVPNLPENVMYLSGSSSMINEVGNSLIEAGLPRIQLKQDQFTGRSGWDVL